MRINRREFAQTILAGSVAFAVRAADGSAILYFVDGYHGGVRGHMPAGAWRDIVTRLDSTPEWKLCLDIEAASWHALAERDPASYARLAEYLQGTGVSPRVEMVGGTFSQPYGWAVTGESNIRQLVRGLEVIHKSFPGLEVDTYAMQEPCWASCLPQILVSLGFKAAVLKDPSTAWGGYSVGIDAETVNWIGPDGTSIRTVPRYACEELVDTWRTEAQMGSEEFAQKCIAHGIAHPAGMCFQDLGWAARPNVEGEYIRFVTWREYMNSVAAKTVRNWRFSMEDIRCALPWGEKTLQKIAQQVRSAENKMITAEKIASMAAAASGDVPYPAEELRQAWEKTLWAQHHDVWITATTRKGRDAWAFQAAAETWDAEAVCDDVIERSLDQLVKQDPSQAGRLTDGNSLHVFNTLGQDRNDLVEIEMATNPGTKALRVLDSAGKEITSQFETTRKYITDRADRVRGGNRSSELKPGESIGAGLLLFRGAVPATGRATYRLETSAENGDALRPDGVTAKRSDDGAVRIESDLYKIGIEPARGGVFSSLYVKALDKEFRGTGERRFHEFRGYFIEEKAWRSSTESPAAVEILEPGPVRVTISITGKISSVPFRTTISVTQGQPRIDFHTQFTFEKDTWIGDPWAIAPVERMTGRRRSEYDDRYKLLALFPVQFQQQSIYKNSAFDVCRSTNEDTFFNSWDTIKHNIVLNWVDLVDERADMGLALLTDHTTSYAHGQNHPLSLVMGWGWDGGFWWGKCPLRGLQEAQYSIIPHAGKWEKALLWNESAKWSEPLLCRLAIGPQRFSKESGQSLVRIGSPGVQLSAMVASGRDLLIRLFNAESAKEEHEVWIGFRSASIELLELDGRQSGGVAASAKDAAGQVVRVGIPKFGVKTLRVANVLS